MLDLLQILHICMTLISFMNTCVFIQFSLANLYQLYLSIADLRGMWHGMDAMSCAQSVPKPPEATYSLHEAQIWQYILILQLIFNLFGGEAWGNETTGETQT
jgi:hypothetical protein